MKNRTIISIFLIIIVISGILTAFNQTEISYSERRKLKAFPSVTKAGSYNKEFFNELDDYLNDHYFMRDDFLKLHAYSVLKLFRQNDIDGVYTKDGYLFKMDKRIDEKSTKYLTELINSISDKYFPNQDKYFVAIPLKNHFLVDNELDYSYEEMLKAIEGIDMPIINTKDYLTLDAYYKTDLHFKQNHLEAFKDLIFEITDTKENEVVFNEKSVSPFYGSYYSYYNGIIKADSIDYLDSELFKDITVYSLDKNGNTNVYDPSAIHSVDGYNFFLDGPTSYLKISNPNIENGQKLIIFRDSFSSSLIPLLIPSFEEIQVFDLRYYRSSYLDNVELNKDAKVLFIYGCEVMNNSYSMR